MDVSVIEQGASRAAIMAWRDEAMLSAMTLMQAAATGAMRALDARLDDVALMNALVGADDAARAIVGPAMRDAVGAAVEAWFGAQALALEQVDARLGPLAGQFAAVHERPVLPEDDVPADRTGASARRRGAAAIGGAMRRVVPAMAVEAVRKASARIGHELGERSGAHDRLRAAAKGELVRRWIGPVPDDAPPRQYLIGLLDLVDCTAARAREIVA